MPVPQTGAEQVTVLLLDFQHLSDKWYQGHHKLYFSCVTIKFLPSILQDFFPASCIYTGYKDTYHTISYKHPSQAPGEVYRVSHHLPIKGKTDWLSEFPRQMQECVSWAEWPFMTSRTIILCSNHTNIMTTLCLYKCWAVVKLWKLQLKQVCSVVKVSPAFKMRFHILTVLIAEDHHEQPPLQQEPLIKASQNDKN